MSIHKAKIKHELKLISVYFAKHLRLTIASYVVRLHMDWCLKYMLLDKVAKVAKDLTSVEGSSRKLKRIT